MRADRIGRTKKSHRLRTRTLGLFLFAGLFTLVMATRFGGRESFAQSAAAPETNPAQNSAQPNGPDGSRAQDAAAGQEAKTEGKTEAKSGGQATAENRAAVTDPKKKQIADQTASLLKLANSLKADVDKTTADTLSVPVIREADEIEKLAHKMRSK